MNWMEILAPAISAIIMALIGVIVAIVNAAVAKYKAKVDAEIENIKDENKQKLAQNALNRVSNLTYTMVAKLEQVSGNALREAVADGKVDKSELEALAGNAYEDIMSQLKDETKVILQEELNDVEGYVKALIEEAVLRIKQ